MTTFPPKSYKYDLTESEEYLRSLCVNPQEVKKGLDEYIIGQDHVKKVLAVAALQRGVRFLMTKKLVSCNTKMQKNNILMLGSSGSGKTALIKALGEVLEVPIMIYDITGTTSSGYVGMKIENIVSNYICRCIDIVHKYYLDRGAQISSEDILSEAIEYAENGIVYVDEFDKCRAVKETVGRDINGEGVQQGLLKLLEGETLFLNDEKNVSKYGIREFNTTNLLVICGGAFQGLQGIIAKRLATKTTIGFAADMSLKDPKRQQELFKELINQDLIEYGFLPEIIGRITHHVALDKLTEDVLVKILADSKNSAIKQYKELFRIWNVQLEFDKNALKYIAKTAMKQKTGARSLNTLISKILIDLQFQIDDLPQGVLNITKNYCQKKLEGSL